MAALASNVNTPLVGSAPTAAMQRRRGSSVAREAVVRLRACAALTGFRVRPVVPRDEIWLLGEVQAETERECAIGAVIGITGVTTVVSRLALCRSDHDLLMPARL